MNVPETKTPSPAESRLSQTERLEMAGLVAGQIAHDFNNLLTPLLAYPDMIRQEVKQNPVVDEYLTIIEKTADEMQVLTQKLLTLARRGRVSKEVFCINDLIVQVIETLQTRIPAGITVKVELADNLLGISGSREQMYHVLDHLCQNAAEAMGTSGVLTLKTENVYLETPIGAYGSIAVGEYVKVSLLDTGAGIPDDLRKKIFDPFFTTKRANKKRGSGLGLSIVYGVVSDHRGYVDFDSKVGEGTSFYLYLPISRDVPPANLATDLPKGSERILVVDDDPSHVFVMINLLKVLGYSSKGAASGEEALTLIKEQRFDLIILDMVMDKGMDGLATFLEIKKSNPAQRVILMSGYSKAARQIVKAQRLGTGTYLRKPLTLERVAEVVRSELDLPVAGMPSRVAPRILIVDDEQMIRKLFGMIITSEFPEALIDQAMDGNEAVEAFSAGCHDLVIMDLQMPGQDGRESFFEILKVCQSNQWPIPPIIFCTGFTPSESLTEIIKDSSIHCLLRKPVKAESLLEAVRKRLQK